MYLTIIILPLLASIVSGFSGRKIYTNLSQYIPDTIVPSISLICFISILSLIIILLASLSDFITDRDMRPILKPGFKDRTDDNKDSDLVFVRVGHNRLFIFDQKDSSGIVPRSISPYIPIVETRLVGSHVYTGVISTSNANTVNQTVVRRRVSVAFIAITSTQYNITTRGQVLRISNGFADINKL